MRARPALIVAASLATTLTAYPAAAAARARFGARARAGPSSPKFPADDDLRAVQRRRGAVLLRRASIDKDLIVAVRVLINGSPIAAYVSTRHPRRQPARQATSFEDRPEGIARDRWDVAIETVNGTMLVECGAIRERVSQELARTVFDAVKRELEGRTPNYNCIVNLHHSVSATPPRWLAARASTNSRSDRRLT